jgi:Ricin-type beta-trefoil lectin domain
LHSRFARWLAVAAAMTVAGLAAPAVPAGAALSPTDSVTPSIGTVVKTQPKFIVSGWKPACDKQLEARAACLVLVDQGVVEPFTHGTSPTVNPSGYGRADLVSAYNLPATGSGQTVAIVDAYDNPNAAANLATYRAQYGLPSCTSTDGCFLKVSQTGTTRYPPVDSSGGWEVEESLDVDMVSAVCPRCHIDLVEANSDSLNDLGTAVDEAVALGAKYVSNSYGVGEFSGENGYDTYYNHPGVAVTAAAGDSGYGVSYPAASPDVVAVGGTSLTYTGSGARGWSETGWGSPSGGAGTGSGCSAYESKPSWQTDKGCSHRTVADVSAVADPGSGLAMYDTYPSTYGIDGWGVVGGTSAASPIIASVYALAGTPAPGSYPAAYLYQQHGSAAINDVTSGANGPCSPAYLCTTETGYDGPTGWGTPEGVAAFRAPTTVPTGPVTSGITGKCLDDYHSGAGNYNVIDIWACNGTGAQIWGVEADATIRNPANGKCLDVYHGGTASGSLVDLFRCNGTSAQVWSAAAGELVNPVSGKCLTGPASGANGTQLRLEPCTGSAAQKWARP